MARENLPTNYVNYELATAMGGMRRFNQISNSDGTISFEDATTYSTTGTTYGANEINTANALINEINELVGTTSISGSGQTDITSLLGGTDITNATLGIGDGTVTGAISKLNSNLTYFKNFQFGTVNVVPTTAVIGKYGTATTMYYGESNVTFETQYSGVPFIIIEPIADTIHPAYWEYTFNATTTGFIIKLTGNQQNVSMPFKWCAFGL